METTLKKTNGLIVNGRLSINEDDMSDGGSENQG